MGRGWRRVTEAVRQKFLLIAPMNVEFEATSNARNETMFSEASEFSNQIRIMEKDLLLLQKHIESQFNNLGKILCGPLPRVFEADGLTPVDAHLNTHHNIGQNVKIDRLLDAPASLKEKLDTEVIGPMSEWVRDYKKIQVEMRKLEAMRLEVDSRRRTVEVLDKQLTQYKMRTMKRGPSTATEAAGGSQLDYQDPRLAELIKDTERKKIHKEEKMQDIRNSFVNHEQVVFNSLFTLIDDARSLRDYAATALVNVQECFASALVAFDTLHQPSIPNPSSGQMIVAVSGTDNPFQQQAVRTPPSKGKGLFSVFTSKLTGKDVEVQDTTKGPVSSTMVSNKQRQDTQYDQRQQPDDLAGGVGFDAATACYGGASKIAPPVRMPAAAATHFDMELPQPPYQAYMQQQMSQQPSRRRDAYAM
ncbi:hypothetical protein CEUSTIGMA_g8848.t1 [Chlamydomonas eustigma]|uniref:BAR domain-containing protein n=1 Tax=Chlamydomonas eustigma TaxID=1157962 RepID=A0A250XEA6_9CHLO|nr:hypothetical protein CEUSTIGMA_g8848.t1 [Chlamydomonas eustigma]|eukprot:GAX81418.1 hypothetical protein CEUSTIGMA_g8848.t1 [Chlamydomonas eustigma]